MPKGAAVFTPEPLAGERLVHDAQQGRLAVGQTDQGSPQRIAHDEGAGAVDGIDDPAAVGAASLVGHFLAGDGVGRIDAARVRPA